MIPTFIINAVNAIMLNLMSNGISSIISKVSSETISQKVTYYINIVKDEFEKSFSLQDKSFLMKENNIKVLAEWILTGCLSEEPVYSEIDSLNLDGSNATKDQIKYICNAIEIKIKQDTELRNFVDSLKIDYLVKEQQRIKINPAGKESVENKIIDALHNVQTIELKVRNREIYGISTMPPERIEKIEFMHLNEAIYPEIMNNKKTFCAFLDEIRAARNQFEQFLNYKISAFLYYIENYCMNLIVYITSIGLNEEYPLAGSVFMFDLLNWQSKIDKEIVNQLNLKEHKLYSKSSVEWEKTKMGVVKDLYDESIMNKLKTNSQDIEILAVRALLSHDEEKFHAYLKLFQKEPLKDT